MIELHGIPVEPTFAEAFSMTATRVIVTAHNERWVKHATQAMCGFATSVIGCVVEAGVDQYLTPEQTPDGRPGASVLMFGMRRDDVAKQLVRRVGQCILTCPSTAIYSGWIPSNGSHWERACASLVTAIRSPNEWVVAGTGECR